jgi:hypothetical protein
LLDQWGCEARKIPAAGDVFSLDFYLYRTNRDLTKPTTVLLCNYIDVGLPLRR